MNTEQHAAIVKRLMEFHTRQSECYHRLIGVLEKQLVIIGTGNEESVLAHIGLGEQIIAEIASIQKSIDPLEAMCQTDMQLDSILQEAHELLAIKAELNALNNRALAQSEQNKAQLSQHMAAIRTEINVLATNPLAMNARRLMYAHAAVPSLIDIRG